MRKFLRHNCKYNNMARKKKPLPLLEEVTITDVAAEGKAIAKVDGLAVFVPYVVPGDVVDLQVRRKKHSYAEAEAVKFHRYATERAVPFCRHFGVCGGCKWQCLPYEAQLQAAAGDRCAYPHRKGGIARDQSYSWQPAGPGLP